MACIAKLFKKCNGFNPTPVTGNTSSTSTSNDNATVLGNSRATGRYKYKSDSIYISTVGSYNPTKSPISTNDVQSDESAVKEDSSQHEELNNNVDGEEEISISELSTNQTDEIVNSNHITENTSVNGAESASTTVETTNAEHKLVSRTSQSKTDEVEWIESPSNEAALFNNLTPQNKDINNPKCTAKASEHNEQHSKQPAMESTNREVMEEVIKSDKKYEDKTEKPNQIAASKSKDEIKTIEKTMEKVTPPTREKQNVDKMVKNIEPKKPVNVIIQSMQKPDPIATLKKSKIPRSDAAASATKANDSNASPAVHTMDVIKRFKKKEIALTPTTAAIVKDYSMEITNELRKQEIFMSKQKENQQQEKLDGVRKKPKAPSVDTMMLQNPMVKHTASSSKSTSKRHKHHRHHHHNADESKEQHRSAPPDALLPSKKHNKHHYHYHSKKKLLQQHQQDANEQKSDSLAPEKLCNTHLIGNKQYEEARRNRQPPQYGGIPIIAPIYLDELKQKQKEHLKHQHQLLLHTYGIQNQRAKSSTAATNSDAVAKESHDRKKNNQSKYKTEINRIVSESDDDNHNVDSDDDADDDYKYNAKALLHSNNKVKTIKKAGKTHVNDIRWTEAKSSKQSNDYDRTKKNKKRDAPIRSPSIDSDVLVHRHNHNDSRNENIYDASSIDSDDRDCVVKSSKKDKLKGNKNAESNIVDAVKADAKTHIRKGKENRTKINKKSKNNSSNCNRSDRNEDLDEIRLSKENMADDVSKHNKYPSDNKSSSNNGRDSGVQIDGPDMPTIQPLQQQKQRSESKSHHSRSSAGDGGSNSRNNSSNSLLQTPGGNSMTKLSNGVAVDASKLRQSQQQSENAGKGKASILNPEESDRNLRKGLIFRRKIENTEAIDIPTFKKDQETRELIRRAIKKNDFLNNYMNAESQQHVIDAMEPAFYDKGDLIIRENEEGSEIYVSEAGEFEVIKNNKVLTTLGPGIVFGELAILYNAKRFASIKAKTKVKVWKIDRAKFRKIIFLGGQGEREQNLKFLKSAPFLEELPDKTLLKLCELLKRKFFAADTRIIRQGDTGDVFFIISGGSVTVKKIDMDNVERVVGRRKRGQYFGERALLKNDKRTASVYADSKGAECLILDREAFINYLGTIEELAQEPKDQDVQPEIKIPPSQFDFIELRDLKKVTCLGAGAFGIVNLMTYNEKYSFALKVVKKIDVIKQGQTDHIYNEKLVMSICRNSPFIVKLYKTFRDNRFIYFLMEACLGGDVWTIMYQRKFFEEKSARFISACVVEAFNFLHTRNIIYRDLKPENLMVTPDGYCKLVDFGFAKRLTANTKTNTFAGTPEYVAPEIILDRGHDRAVDYWALGILIYELLAGRTPFRGTNQMKIYQQILTGIDAVSMSSKIQRTAQGLIKNLCKQTPAERLGYQRRGILDIKKHSWYDGFDWNKLCSRQMSSPIKRPVDSITDTRYFPTKFENEGDVPPEETSGWDEEF